MLIVLAVVLAVAALLVLGPYGLIPFGLLLACADSDEEGAGRSVILSRPNLGLAGAMVLAFAGFWVWQLELPESMLVVIGVALIALPLALEEFRGGEARDRTIVVTKRSLILALWGLVVFIFLYYEELNSAQMNGLIAAVATGLVLLAALALLPRRAAGHRLLDGARTVYAQVLPRLARRLGLPGDAADAVWDQWLGASGWPIGHGYSAAVGVSPWAWRSCGSEVG